MKGAPFLGWRTLRDEVLPASAVALVGLGQPLLDIIADVDPAYLQVDVALGTPLAFITVARY